MKHIWLQKMVASQNLFPPQNIVAGRTPLEGCWCLASKDEYFVRKKLYPNVDFYSGITRGLHVLVNVHCWVAQRKQPRPAFDSNPLLNSRLLRSK